MKITVWLNLGLLISINAFSQTAIIITAEKKAVILGDLSINVGSNTTGLTFFPPANPMGEQTVPLSNLSSIEFRTQPITSNDRKYRSGTITSVDGNQMQGFILVQDRFSDGGASDICIEGIDQITGQSVTYQLTENIDHIEFVHLIDPAALETMQTPQDQRIYYSGSHRVKLYDKNGKFVEDKILTVEVIAPAFIKPNEPARFEFRFLPEGYDDAEAAQKVYQAYHEQGPFGAKWPSSRPYPHIRIGDKSSRTWSFYPSICLITPQNSIVPDPVSVRWKTYFPVESPQWRDTTPFETDAIRYQWLESLSLDHPTSNLVSGLQKLAGELQSASHPGKMLGKEYDTHTYQIKGPYNLLENPVAAGLEHGVHSEATAHAIEMEVTFKEAGVNRMFAQLNMNLEIRDIEVIPGGVVSGDMRKPRLKGTGDVVRTIGFDVEVGNEEQEQIAEPEINKSNTWIKTFGGSGNDAGWCVKQTSDRGYIVTGSRSGDVYLIKTNASGTVQWSRTFGGNCRDFGFCVQQTSDGGYIIVGRTASYGAGDKDVYLIKTDASGTEQWSRAFGGSSYDMGNSVQQTSDGGYIITGTTWSYGDGGSDVYLIKTNCSGTEQWSRTFGGSSDDMGLSVQQTSDGGYIIAGHTESFGAGDTDAYLIRTDISGIVLWHRTFGGSERDESNCVQQTSDGGYIIVGNTRSYDTINGDIYLISTDVSGNEQWCKTFGWDMEEEGYSVQQTSNGGYIIVGNTKSYGTLIGDIYLISTDISGNEQWCKTFGGDEAEDGWSVQQTSDGGYIIVGFTHSYGAGKSDILLIKTDANGNVHTEAP
ncbi:hypothetical protein CEE37_14375 [candidate division LCP-89 bacterium B3_LCP]|uniref:Bulb-type lectin domain-containing protein n=1 Tax=candidate division LCP-89 bacterium B3_LCP TaxID=2012998 RepID=A0A532UPP1_UNCL8|nr:MAG: hypothetical protein CEE37_14375 [candidate division LCP-89 bacterium B3_LCP]